PLDLPPPRSTRFGSPLVLSRVHWVRPELIAEVKFLTWTGDNLRARSSMRVCATTSPQEMCAARRRGPNPADRGQRRHWISCLVFGQPSRLSPGHVSPLRAHRAPGSTGRTPFLLLIVARGRKLVLVRLQKKIGEADFFLRKLREQEPRIIGDKEPFDYYLSAFLNAAMSVRDAFQIRQDRPRNAAVKAWRERWECDLTA